MSQIILYMDISKRISEVRESKGITQTEVARRLDMEQSNYSRLEKRGNRLTFDLIERIAEALGVTIFELLGYESNPQSERIQQLETKVAELKKLLKEAAPLRTQVDYIEKQLVLYEELYKQSKHRSKEIELWAKDIVSSLEAGNEDTLKNTIKFIKAVYFANDDTNKDT